MIKFLLSGFMALGSMIAVNDISYAEQPHEQVIVAFKQDANFLKDH